MLFDRFYFLILILGFSLPSPAAERLHCETHFIQYQTPTVVLAGEILQSRPEDTKRFVRKDVTNHFFFSAKLSEEGVLTFSTILRMFELPVRSGLYGPRLFREMMEHFGAQNVDVIVGRWVDGTNLNLYSQALQKGSTREEAALLTWTGQQAAQYGFNKIRSLSDVGRPGQKTVVVEFARE